jgi:hypothetical protein
MFGLHRIMVYLGFGLHRIMVYLGFGLHRIMVGLCMYHCITNEGKMILVFVE